MKNIIGFFRVLSPLILLGVALFGAHYFFSVGRGAPCTSACVPATKAPETQAVTSGEAAR